MLTHDGASVTPLYLVEPADMQAVRESLDSVARRWIEAQGFRATLGEVVAAPDADGGLALALVGWGDPTARARGRFHLAGAAAKLPPGVYRIETALDHAEAEECALGWMLGGYRFDRYSKHETPQRRLVTPDGVVKARLEAIAEGVFLARDMINTPANDMGPEALEAAAREVAERFGASIEVVAGPALVEGFPLIHAVGRASEQPPRLIHLRWGDLTAPRITIVGKGVCFDSGGLDIKPASGMRLMKKDMGGAATALGLAHMIMARRLKVRLKVLIPAVENAIGPGAFRPGDVLRSRKGLSVEVSNTDAEGRLILADALALACEKRPEVLVDFATLTGAARVALGPDLPALFTDNEPLAAELAMAAARARDPLWRLPLWGAYEDEVKSPVADLDNAPEGGMAGAITAALFLKRFVQGAKAWAHFDLYAWNAKAKPGRPMGGEMQAGRAVFAMLEQRYG